MKENEAAGEANYREKLKKRTEFYKSKLGLLLPFNLILNEIFKWEQRFSKSNLAKKFICIFENKYMCEQLFSKMNHIKSKIWLKLSDGHLDSLLRLACSNILADREMLSQQKQH